MLKEGIFIMNIEKLATSAVEDSISMTDTMSPFVNAGDSEPVWDGNIYIYKNKEKKKDGIKKVPVQVKGKLMSNLNQNAIKYSLEVSYLKDYLDDGGVFFFVVCISKNGEEKQIYYSALTPIKLKLLLSDVQINQKTKSFELQKFPTDNNKKTSILLNFYENMKKQTSFRHVTLMSEEELRKKGMIEAITIPIINYGNTNIDARDALLQMDEVYMYATIKGTSISQPLQEMPINIHLFEQAENDITIKGQKYYNSFKRIKTKDKTIITIGKSVTLSLPNDNNSLKIDIKPTPILKDALQDLPFLIEMADKCQFEVNGGAIKFDNAKIHFTKERLEIIKSRYEFCQSVSKLFKRLRLNENYDLSNFTEEDYKITRILYDSLILNKPISGLRTDIPYFTAIDYAGTKIALLFKKTSVSGTYTITDFFTDRSYVVYRIDDNKERFLSSKYVNFTAENFLQFGNIDYDDIIDSFSAYKDAPHCFEESNFILLKMLLAYDQSKDIRKDILYNAEKLSNWILGAHLPDCNLHIAKINNYQILKRMRSLSHKEQDDLIAMLDEVNQNNKVQEYSLKVGIYLLLDNQRSAEFYYNKLDNENKEVFKQYPIFRFVKKVISTI